MMKSFRSCLQVSTYNWPSALNLCLQSIMLQKVMPDEVVIADDGSGSATKEVIDAFKKQCPIPVVHIWHDDTGYKLPVIQNKAIMATTCDYIIQIDGDCLLHPMFVADHIHFAKQGTFICGSRGMLDETFTNNLLQSSRLIYPLNAGEHLSKKYNTVYSRPIAFLNYLFQRKRKNYLYVKGCNMAFWKKDLLEVNGHNESFEGWGKEDNDISLRLLNSGKGIRFLKFGGIQYHLYHKQSDTSKRIVSEALLAETEKNGLTVTKNGIVKTA